MSPICPAFWQSAKEVAMSGRCASAAKAWASSVLPVPGGPWKITLRGTSAHRRVPARQAAMSAASRRICATAVSWPATASRPAGPVAIGAAPAA
jgi:hypothetical protein